MASYIPLASSSLLRTLKDYHLASKRIVKIEKGKNQI